MKYLILFFAGILCLGCNKLELENQNLPDVENLKAGEMQTSLDIVHINADQGAFNYMYGRYKEKILVDGQLSMTTPSGDSIVKNKHVKMEIKGSASAVYDMKSLGFVFDTAIRNYQGSILSPPEMLEQHSLEYFYTFRLRNSGNDFGVTMIKDLAYTRFAIQMGLDLELMYGKPVHAFVNDQYFGLLNLRTESGPRGMGGLLKKKPDDITIVKVDKDNGNLEIEEGNGLYATQLRKALNAGNELQLYHMLDISNFIDYLIFQDYIGNRDWPQNNVRAHSVGGAPFRFIVYDLDYAAFNTKNAKLPEMEYLEDDVSKIYQSLREIPSFREQLEKRKKELYRKFSPKVFNGIIDEMALQIEAEIPYLMARYQQPPNILKWKMNLDELKREFERRDHYIRKKYDL